MSPRTRKPKGLPSPAKSLPRAPSLQVTSPSGGRLDVSFETQPIVNRASSPPILQYQGDLYAMTADEPYLLPKEMQWYDWDPQNTTVLAHMVVTALPGQKKEETHEVTDEHGQESASQGAGNNDCLPIVKMGRDPGYPETVRSLIDETRGSSFDSRSWVNSTASIIGDDTVSLVDTVIDSAEILRAPVTLASDVFETKPIEHSMEDVRAMADNLVDEEWARWIASIPVTVPTSEESHHDHTMDERRPTSDTPPSTRLATPKAGDTAVLPDLEDSMPSLMTDGDQSMQADNTLDTIADQSSSPDQPIKVASQSSSLCRSELNSLRDRSGWPLTDCGASTGGQQIGSPVGPRLIDFSQDQKNSPQTPKKTEAEADRILHLLSTSTCSPQWGDLSPAQAEFGSSTLGGVPHASDYHEKRNDEAQTHPNDLFTPAPGSMGSTPTMTTDIELHHLHQNLGVPPPRQLTSISPSNLHINQPSKLPRLVPASRSDVRRVDGSRPPAPYALHGKFRRHFVPVETSNVRGATTPSPARSVFGSVPPSPVTLDGAAHASPVYRAHAAMKAMLATSASSMSPAPIPTAPTPTQPIWHKGGRSGPRPPAPNRKFVPPARVTSSTDASASIAPNLKQGLRTPPRRSQAGPGRPLSLQGLPHPELMPSVFEVVHEPRHVQVAPPSGSPGYKRQMATTTTSKANAEETELLSSPLAARTYPKPASRAFKSQRQLSGASISESIGERSPAIGRFRAKTVEPKLVMSDTIGPRINTGSLASATEEVLQPKENLLPRAEGNAKEMKQKDVDPPLKRSKTSAAKGKGRGRGGSTATAHGASRAKTAGTARKRSQKAQDDEPSSPPAKKQKQIMKEVATRPPSSPLSSPSPAIDIQVPSEPVGIEPISPPDDIEVKREALTQVAEVSSDIPIQAKSRVKPAVGPRRAYSDEEMHCILQYLGPDPATWTWDKASINQLMGRLTAANFPHQRTQAALGVKVRTMRTEALNQLQSSADEQK